MRIMVTGGAGFIGANFLNLLVPRHEEHHFINADKLTYAANLASLAGIADKPNYTFVQLDIADAQAVEEAFEAHTPDCVVHFAAESHVDRSIEGPRAFIESNIIGTFNLLESARKRWGNGNGLFHHVSTDEVYGSLGDTGMFVEDTRYDPSSPYSASKAASDHLVRAHHRTFGMAAILNQNWANCALVPHARSPAGFLRGAPDGARTPLRTPPIGAFACFPFFFFRSTSLRDAPLSCAATAVARAKPGTH